MPIFLSDSKKISMAFISTNLSIANTPKYKHDKADIILEKARIISDKLGIIKPGLYQGHTTMTNYIYINTPVDKMVDVLVTYDAFYFLDDFFGEDTHKGALPDFNAILKIWEGATPVIDKNQDVTKLYHAIAYCSKTLRDKTPDAFFKQYTKSVIAHIQASLVEKTYQSVSEYIAIRLQSSGMFLVIDLIEYLHDTYLGDKLKKHPQLHLTTLCKTCALIGGLSNDIFSYAKEKHSKYNLINAYLETKKADTITQASAMAIEKVNALHQEFIKVLGVSRKNSLQLPKPDTLKINTYLDALEVIVASSYHWQKITNRYLHKENIFEDLRMQNL